MDQNKLKTAAVGVGFLFLTLLAYGVGTQGEAPWYSVVPPLFAVTLALVTGKVVLSLALSVVVGGLLIHIPQAPGLISSWGRGIAGAPILVWNSASDTTNLQILLFVVFIMAAISVMILSGGLQGIVNWLAKYARSARSSQVVTAGVGVLLFIDDYANTMIVGNSLRPMTDKYRVSREKLAFLVDATSAPIAGLAVISTWIGYEVGLFAKVSESLGMGLDGYSMFFDALPFRFYCILMLIFVFINVISGHDFGPMAKAQERAQRHNHLQDPTARPMTSKAFSAAVPDKDVNVQALSGILPIGGVFSILVFGLWWDGGGPSLFAQSAWAPLSFDAWRTVMSNSENSILLLAYAAAFSWALAVFCAKALSRMTVNRIWEATLMGLQSSALPILILVLAWSLKGACDGLLTGKFLASTLGQVVSALWFPLLLFVAAGMTAFATGTSWGTMAILIPTAIPVAFALDGDTYGLVTMISLGAVLDGAIFGDHCSPISDTTIMSSISSSCDHIHHVRTQMPYALFVATLAIVCGYLPAALGSPSWLGIAVASVLMGMWFLALSRRRSVGWAQS